MQQDCLIFQRKFRLQHNEAIVSLQYCKLHRKENESMCKWLGRLCIKEEECSNKEPDRWLKEQFINTIDNKEIVQEIIKELMAQNM